MNTNMIPIKVKYLFMLLLVSFLLLLVQSLRAQEPDPLRNYTLNGYLKYMNSIMDRKGTVWINESMFHNRLEFGWNPSPNIDAGASLRTRFIYGDWVESFPSYQELISMDHGYFHKLTSNLVEENSFLLNTSVDRLWMNMRRGKFEVRIGRQRINWGQAYVWNPNDIFNAYSFFDFDYEERPGSDAIRLMYYPSFTSSAEVSVKMNHDQEVTAAGYYRLNQWGYDWQILGGIFNDDEYVAGLGWAGHINDAGFNGEITYLMPEKHFSDTSGILLTTLSVNYMFNNALYLQFEGYYNGNFQYMDGNNFINYYYRPLTIKTLSFSEFSWFGQASYPIHPLLEGTMAFMIFPDIEGFFINPSLQYSLTDNVQLSAFAQLFEGKFSGENKERINFMFFRFKWSF